MCKIDNSKATVTLDPDGMKAEPTLGSGSELNPTFRVKYGADPVG